MDHPIQNRQAGILGLGVAGVLLTQTTILLADIGEVRDIPAGWTAMLVVHFVIAGLALLGAVLVFARRGGTFLLMTAAVLTVAGLLLDPVMAEGVWYSMVGPWPGFTPAGDHANYFAAMVEFGNEQAMLRFAGLVLGAVLLVVTVLPPSLDRLRRSRDDSHGRYHPGRG